MYELTRNALLRCSREKPNFAALSTLQPSTLRPGNRGLSPGRHLVTAKRIDVLRQAAYGTASMRKGRAAFEFETLVRVLLDAMSSPDAPVVAVDRVLSRNLRLLSPLSHRLVVILQLDDLVMQLAGLQVLWEKLNEREVELARGRLRCRDAGIPLKLLHQTLVVVLLTRQVSLGCSSAWRPRGFDGVPFAVAFAASTSSYRSFTNTERQLTQRPNQWRRDRLVGDHQEIQQLGDQRVLGDFIELREVRSV